MTRFCGSCGTEVDDTAVFCPTCGQPIDDGAEAEMPAAPAWPDPAATDAPHQPAPPRDEPEPAQPPGDQEPAAAESSPDAPTRIEERPPHPESASTERAEPHRSERRRRPPADADRPAGDRGGMPQLNLPLTMPVTLSGWLIGIGSLLAVIGLLVILITGILNVIDLLLFLALLGVAATVFFSARLPGIPHVRLATLVIALIAFGVALDRIGFRGGGAGELLLFLGSAAAAIGSIILELGRDQPLGGDQP